MYAWKQCYANKGSAGVDGLTFKEIQTKIGVENYISEIKKELRSNSYKPQPVRRVYLDKPDGSKRPLGIPTIKDRIIQMACLIIIMPIFEADFHTCSYGFRPKRSAHQAIKSIVQNIKEGYTAVYDADLTKCFDNIPHQIIMDSIKERIADSKIIELIKGWLTAPVVEPRGPRQGRKNQQGTPQGGVISPLLANIVLNKLDQYWYSPGGPREKYNARLIRYADDFVVMARYIGNPIKQDVEQAITPIGLSLNQKKTGQLNLANGDILTFLGYNIYLQKGVRLNVRLNPSDKAIKKLRDQIREIISRKRLYHGIIGIIQELNPVLRGWRQYFKLCITKRLFSDIDFYVTGRFYRVGRKTSQRFSKIFKPGVYSTLRKLGLYSLTADYPVNA